MTYPTNGTKVCRNADHLPPPELIVPKTCERCLGKRQVIVNAGTGLLAPCPKCAKK